MYQAEQRRAQHAQADLIQSIATGYGGCKSKEGWKAMDRVARALRR